MDARPDSALCREASFAPVTAVLPFDALEDALDMNGRCPYGLGASVFTRDVRKAAALAALLPAGMVTVNDVIAPTAHPATPFGGVGESGWGATQGAEGLLEMTTTQVVSVRGGTFRPHYELAAGGNAAKQGDLLRALLESGHAGDVRPAPARLAAAAGRAVAAVRRERRRLTTSLRCGPTYSSSDWRCTARKPRLEVVLVVVGVLGGRQGGEICLFLVRLFPSAGR